MNTGIQEMTTVKGLQEATGLGRSQAYDLLPKLPAGIVVKLGARRIRLLTAPLNEWLRSGGNLNHTQRA